MQGRCFVLLSLKTPKKKERWLPLIAVPAVTPVLLDASETKFSVSTQTLQLHSQDFSSVHHRNQTALIQRMLTLKINKWSKRLQRNFNLASLVDLQSAHKSPKRREDFSETFRLEVKEEEPRGEQESNIYWCHIGNRRRIWGSSLHVQGRWKRIQTGLESF